MYPKVYDQNMSLVAILDKAFSVGYQKRFNELWTAHFSLPADDIKNEECQPFRFVEIFDGDDRVDLFRIVPTETARSKEQRTITYQLEHVLAILLDDVLFQYHQVGGTSVYTADVIEYILSKQAVGRWQLGQTDFTHQFMYNFENENLLSALFSVPKPFFGAYQWTWDTSSYPWTVNLTAPDDEITAYIRYKKNLVGVKKTEDPTELFTRIYPLGYGEGVNQLGISGVNPTGKPYIDADTQVQYGVISRVWVDRRYESEETLFNAAKAILEEAKHPAISYSVDAADLYQITRDSVDKFECGALVQVIDSEMGFDFNAHVMSVSKSDVTGNPGGIQIEIANKAKDITSSISDLADKAKINELYSQGATNLDSHDFADNCDPENPAVIKFYIPKETVRINKMLLSYETEAFRAYSKAMTANGSHRHRMFKWAGGGIWEDIEYFNTSSAGSHNHAVSNDFPSGEHNHGNPDYIGTGQHSHSLGTNQTGSHQHQQIVPIMRTWDCQNVEGDWQNVGIGSPMNNADLWTYEAAGEHTHDIDYGIYKGPTPTSITVKVDGNTITGMGLSETDLDIIPYLAKDEGGKVQRGTWHEITIAPDNLGRIIANVVTQLFVQSRGGGNY